MKLRKHLNKEFDYYVGPQNFKAPRAIPSGALISILSVQYIDKFELK